MTHYILKYKQDRLKPTYILFDEKGNRIMQNSVLQGLRNNAYRNNIMILSKDVPFDLFERIKATYLPDNLFSPVRGGSILEESLQDNDLTP
jgi:hypothetical protein